MEPNQATIPPVGVVAPAQPIASPVVQTSTYIGFRKRLLAYLVDAMVLLVISIALGSGIHLGGGSFGPGLIISALYFVFFWVKQDGQTLGNKLMAIKVIREDGTPIDWTTGILRFVGYLVSGIVLDLGFLWIIWDNKKQGWHDKIARTVVVPTGEKPKTAIAVLIVAGFFGVIILLIIVLSAGTLFFIKYAKNHPNTASTVINQNPSLQQVFPSLSPDKEDTLADNTFTSINSIRQKDGLPQLSVYETLCGYAQRRLQQITSFGKLDDYKGFTEDSANPQISQAYFSGLTYIDESDYGTVTGLSTGDDIANYFDTPQSVTAVTNPKANQGCVRASGSYMVILSATQ